MMPMSNPAKQVQRGKGQVLGSHQVVIIIDIEPRGMSS